MDYDIPIPSPKRGHLRRQLKRLLNDEPIGASLFLPGIKRQRVGVEVEGFGTGRYATKQEPDGVRVWRIA